MNYSIHITGAAKRDIAEAIDYFDNILLNKAILTHGFIKKTQKTPPSEIERAIRYRKEYFSRKEQDR